MAAACKHSRLLSSVYSVKYEGVDVQSPKCELPFRPGTKFSLVLKTSPSVEQSVRIAVEGSAEGLMGAIWILDEHGGYFAFPLNVQLNTNYWFTAPLNSRVFCKVWASKCPFCSDQAKQKAAHQKELQCLLSQARVSELQPPTEDAFHSRLHQLEREAAADERKLAAALKESDARMAKNAELASTIQSLEAKLGERKKAAKEAADRETALVEQRAVLEHELNVLKSSLSNEQTRSASLRRQLDEHEKKARESKKEAIERERMLAAVQQENAAAKQKEENLSDEIFGLKLALEDQTAAREAAVAETSAAANEASSGHALYHSPLGLQIATLLSKVAHLESELKKREDQAIAATDREKALVEQHSVLERQISGLKSTFFNEQSRAFSLQRGLQRQLDELKKSVRVVEEAAIERESKLAAVRRENEAFAGETAQLVEGISVLAAALKQQKKARETAAAEKAVLAKENEELKRQKERVISKLPSALLSADDCNDSSSFSEQPVKFK